MIEIENYIYYNKTNKIKKSIFVKKLGVIKNSYMGQVISRIYDFYFRNEQLLKKEYKKYYIKEFDSFEKFLDKKHNLFNNEIKELNYRLACCSEKQLSEMYSFYNLYSSNGYESNVLKEKIIELLNVKALSTEDLYED